MSRTLAACEGAVLLVDAAQGVEAQTIGNLHLARENGLRIIPVINKVDLPSAEPELVREEVVDILDVEPADVMFCSAKTGEGVRAVLESIIALVPPPSAGEDARLRALVFDSTYDQYRGVVTFVRVVSGRLEEGAEIGMMAAGSQAVAETVGYLSPDMVRADSLSAGEVGFVATGIKDVSKLPVGYTLTVSADAATEPLPGYREPKPVVFAGLFPIENKDYQNLREALAKLRLNDSSLTYEPETSQALGFGFRCGFLGLLHMEVVRDRLEREYDLELIITPPNVVYRVTDKAGEVTVVKNPSEMPPANSVAKVAEPYVSLLLIMPGEMVGPVMELCQQRRALYRDMVYLSTNRVELSYDMPLGEMV